MNKIIAVLSIGIILIAFTACKTPSKQTSDRLSGISDTNSTIGNVTLSTQGSGESEEEQSLIDSETPGSFPTSKDASGTRPASTTTSSISKTVTNAITPTVAAIKYTYTELVRDQFFANGFNVRGLSPTVDGTAVRAVFNYGNNLLAPAWVIAQWSSRYSIADDYIFTTPSSKLYRYENINKIITVNTTTGEIGLKALASKCYDAPRQEGESWMHLLLENGFAANDKQNLNNYKLDGMKELRVKMKVKLSYFKDMMGGEARRGLHAAQYTLFLTLSDLNPNSSSGYGDMIWFGIPVLDNRNEYLPVYAAEDAGQSGASGKFIYSMSNTTYLEKSFFKDGIPVGSDINDWIEINVDILPHIKEAFSLAKSRNYLVNTGFDELYANGMNIGWELPGTYDVEMKLKDFSISAGR